MLRTSKSTTILKENYNPSRQGAFYELNLGKNNGPFLSKDIMFNNRKSMGLLTNLQILKSHETMVTTMSNMQQSDKKKQCKIGTEKVENFNGLIQYCESELKLMSQVSNNLKLQEKDLKKQLQEFSIKGHQSVTQLYESSMPGIKQFMKKIREVNSMDKEENYRVRRQLQKMSMDVSLLKKGVVECENKIEKLEKTFTNEQDTVNQQQIKLW